MYQGINLRMSLSLRVLCLCFFLGVAANATSLTGVALFGVNSSGTQDFLYIWNSLGSDIPFNLYLQQGGFLNSGNGSGARVNTPLAQGSNTFTYFADTFSGSPTNYGLNLFFDGNDTTPLISAKLVGGVMSANSASSTRQLSGAFVAGAGTLSFTDALGVTYTLTQFTKTTTGNVVRPYDNIPSLIPNSDITGTFTLLATAPEPGTFALAAIGLLAVAGTLARRRIQ